MKTFTKYFFLCLFALASSGVLYQQMSTFIEERQYPPFGELVDVGGYRLHLNGSGKGDTTVILDAGLAMNSIDWVLVQPEIASFARVYSYDRAGLGWSDENSAPRTSLQMVIELHQLLQAAHIDPPYILVGHSSGGANVLMYAIMYPKEVSGLVLVDSVHENQSKLLPADPAPAISERLTSYSDPYLGWITVPLGISRFFLHFSDLQSELDHFPDGIKDAYFAKINSPKYARTAYEEDVHFDESLQQLSLLKHQINIPIIVITAGAPIDPSTAATEDLVWARFQEEICALSDKSIHLYAENSDHMIPWHQPEIVAEAVRLLILQ